MAFSVVVQEVDFDVGTEYQKLVHQNTSAGAVVFFVGRVRDMNLTQSVTGLYLEHYPGMTERVLYELVEQAKLRWPLIAVSIIHRVGQLDIGDQIVFVGVTSAHREVAFQSAEFLMDYLKNEAPFWKKENQTENKSNWIESRDEDRKAQARWKQE